MIHRTSVVLCLAAVLLPACTSDGNAQVQIAGERRQWHKVTLTLDGPCASETGDPNPFLDYRMSVMFAHESGSPKYEVPGYFAADGNAAETSATSGTKWRAHLSPDKTGRWTWEVSFLKGSNVTVLSGGEPHTKYNGLKGEFRVAASDKKGVDFRARGRLQHVGKRYLQFAGTREWFLKAGADSPETLLAFADFDGTETRKSPLKSYAPHVQDWRTGDPTWKNGKGKGLIGALNYLAGKGMNAISFLTYNAGGDGDNVWPMTSRDDKLRYDCSKLDQWGIVFDHAQRLGLYLHFKLQETENDDERHGTQRKPGAVPTALDGGSMGRERRLYLRELVARFGYQLALNWNLGEENTQTPEEQRAMAGFLADMDPYDNHRVVHTYPQEQDKVYRPLLGTQSALTGVSLQNAFDAVHRQTAHWIVESAKAGKQWVVANDEQGTADLGVPPDPGYEGFKGTDKAGKPIRTLHDIRKQTLWGNLIAGGAGVEYYFGYTLPQNDLALEDFRSRDKSWGYARIALDFFRVNRIPFAEMEAADRLVNDGAWCLAKAGSLYLVYLPDGGSASIDLGGSTGAFSVQWFDPRSGGALKKGSVTQVNGGARVDLGTPPSEPGDDWLALVKKQ
jgi:hypothetical protein